MAVYDKRVKYFGDDNRYGKDWIVSRKAQDYIQQNRVRVAAGGEYIPNAQNRNFFNRVRYRAGAHYSNSYLMINNKDEDPAYKGNGYNEYGVSVGMGLPLIDNRSLINVSFEYTKIKPGGVNMIDEQYFRFTVNHISLNV